MPKTAFPGEILAGVAPPHLRQLLPARRYILSQRAGVIRRPDAEVQVVRRAPLGDDRQDLDELVSTGEAARRLVASMPRVAVDGNRACIAHPPSVHARDLVGRRPCAIAVASVTRGRYVLSRVFSGPMRAGLPELVAMSQ